MLQWPHVVLCAEVDGRKWNILLPFAHLALYARTPGSTKAHTESSQVTLLVGVWPLALNSSAATGSCILLWFPWLLSDCSAQWQAPASSEGILSSTGEVWRQWKVMWNQVSLVVSSSSFHPLPISDLLPIAGPGVLGPNTRSRATGVISQLLPLCHVKSPQGITCDIADATKGAPVFLVVVSWFFFLFSSLSTYSSWGMRLISEWARCSWIFSPWPHPNLIVPSELIST